MLYWLAEVSGIAQAMLSTIENGRVRLGVKRAKVLARALRCHPAVLVFPGWSMRLILQRNARSTRTRRRWARARTFSRARLAGAPVS